MAYQIDRYNNTILTNVQDGTIDNTTDIKLIGRNFSGYGELQNENFLYLLENFSGAIEPPRAISGQLWYDSGNGKIKFYDGTKFRTASGAEASPTQPSGQVRGDLWWNTSTEQLFSFNGSDHVLVGPLFAGFENTQIISAILIDTQAVEHTVLQVVIGGDVVYIVSDSEFTIGSATPVPGFTDVKKGLTLVNTNNLGVSGDGYVYWGSASNALRLGGVAASDYLLKTNPNFPDSGFTVGDSNDLVVFVENGNEPVLQNQVGNSNKIKFICNNDVGNAIHSVAITAEGIIPGANNSFEIGADANRWNTVYATTFNGVATTAQYADLAEVYSSDKDYEPGTVVKLGGDYEITQTTSEFDTEVFGVISENPAYLMNSEAEGLPVALTGRVKVKVMGKVKKGERLVSSPTPGYAWALGEDSYDARYIIGRSLENKESGNSGTVEAVIGVK